MTGLADIQVRFASGVTGDPAAVLDALADDGRQAHRFEIHRNNTFAALAGVLEQAFPTVAAILGPGFFQKLSAAFVRHAPPAENHLLGYGAGLPDFIRRSEPLADRPWLGDVARLDWAVHDAYGAPDATPLTPEDLAAQPPEGLAEMPLPLHPSARLIASDWPVHAIRMNPAVASGETELARRAESVLVIRPQLDVIAIPVAAAELSFLVALQNGQSLGAAAGSGLGTDPAFDIQGALARHLAGGHFVQAPNPDNQGDPQ